MNRTILIGYGNTDRQDDGIAWHLLVALAERLGRPGPFTPEEGFPPSLDEPSLLFVLQLTPELAEIIAQSEQVCFIDAHTGTVPEDIQMTHLTSQFQSSIFTHHLTAQSCLALCLSLYKKEPQAVLLSVRGYEFSFSRQLSTRTQCLLPKAVDTLWSWLFPSLSQR